MTKVSTYLRCSTSLQDTESQANAVKDFVASRWGDSVKVDSYADEARSGADSNRPDLERLLQSVGMPALPKRKFGDTEEKFIIVSELSRLARDTDALLWILSTASMLGVKIIPALKPDGAQGEEADVGAKMVARLLAVIAAGQTEQERENIMARTAAGVENVRKNGDGNGDKRWGGERVPVGVKGGRALTDDQEDEIMTKRFNGTPVAVLSDEYGVSEPTCRKAIKRAEARETDRQEAERAAEDAEAATSH